MELTTGLEINLARVGNKTTCPVSALINKGRILLGLRHYAAQSVWTCPGGRCETNESIESALKREIVEETGIQELTFIAYIGEVVGANKGDIVPFFLSTTHKDPILMEPKKFSEWRWVKLVDFLNGNPKDYINELTRQANSLVAIAQFKLKRIGNVFRNT